LTSDLANQYTRTKKFNKGFSYVNVFSKHLLKAHTQKNSIKPILFSIKNENAYILFFAFFVLFHYFFFFVEINVARKIYKIEKNSIKILKILERIYII